LAGFRSPAYAQGIGVTGFHLHFLRQLPTSAEFLKANIEDPALNKKIKAAEGYSGRDQPSPKS
jgi:alpha-acetolactate decarboxylase